MPDDSDTKKIDSFISQLKRKLKKAWLLLKNSVYYNMNIQTHMLDKIHIELIAIII
jgi:hypothetical protein